MRRPHRRRAGGIEPPAPPRGGATLEGVPVFRFQPLFALLATVSVALILAACGSDNQTAENTDGDSTSIASAGGSMESDGENFGQGDEEKEKPKKKKKKKEKSTSLQASLAFNGDLVKPVIAEGTIRARHSAEIRAEITGKVMRVYADEGAMLRTGQLIARIDDREYRVAAEEARANYLQALSLLAIEQDDIVAQEMTQEDRDELADLERKERTGEITRQQRLVPLSSGPASTWSAPKSGRRSTA